MAFNGSGAVQGGASGAAAGSVFGPWGAAIGGVGGALAGGFMGKKKVKPIDISQQLALVKQKTDIGRGRVENLYNDMQKPTDTYKMSTEEAIEAARARNLGQKTDFLKEQEGYITQAKDALRKNLYSETFSGLPDALRAVRESSAAGGGLDTGSYQQALKETGIDTARQLVQGETGIQAQGMQTMSDVSAQAHNIFTQLSSKLDDQGLDMLAKVMDSKRFDLAQRTAQQLGLDADETQAIIDLMNFSKSGEMASQSADSSSQQAMLSGLMNLGGTIAASRGGRVTSQPVARDTSSKAFQANQANQRRSTLGY